MRAYDTTTIQTTKNHHHAGVNVGHTAGVHLQASYGTSFNAPSFFETRGSAYNRSNHCASPNEATLDGALEGRQSYRVEFAVASAPSIQHFSQLIQYVAGENSGPPDYTPITPSYYDNLTQARAKGMKANCMCSSWLD